jgi:hypothetical protein
MKMTHAKTRKLDRDQLVLWWLEACLGACGAFAIIVAVLRVAGAWH